MAATVLDQNGQPMPAETVAWTSSDGSVATVSGDGVVTAVANGETTLTATSGAVTRA